MCKKAVMVLMVFALLAVPVAWSTNQAAEAAPPLQGEVSERTITVTGYGVAYGSPDIVRLGLGVEASEQDIMAAMDSVNSRMNAVIAALKEGGVKAEDIRTEYYSIWQDYSYSPGLGMPEPAGGERPAPFYRVSTTAEIVIRDTESVGELIEVAVTAGANIINYVEFAIEDQASLQSDARSLAVADAQDRAAQLAATLGLTVGEAVRVVEGSEGLMPLKYGGGAGYGGAMESSVPPISGGQLSVSMSVTITFALQ